MGLGVVLGGEGKKKSVKLEDSEFDYLEKKFDAFRWGVANKAILGLEDAIKNSKAVTA